MNLIEIKLLEILKTKKGETTAPLCYYVPASSNGITPGRLREDVREEPPWWIA